MSSSKVDRSLQGIGLCTLGYAFLSLQDAVIKWLVADYSVVTILSVSYTHLTLPTTSRV